MGNLAPGCRERIASPIALQYNRVDNATHKPAGPLLMYTVVVMVFIIIVILIIRGSIPKQNRLTLLQKLLVKIGIIRYKSINTKLLQKLHFGEGIYGPGDEF